jgi:hypothetical protein
MRPRLTPLGIRQSPAPYIWHVVRGDITGQARRWGTPCTALPGGESKLLARMAIYCGFGARLEGRKRSREACGKHVSGAERADANGIARRQQDHRFPDKHVAAVTLRRSDKPLYHVRYRTSALPTFPTFPGPLVAGMAAGKVGNVGNALAQGRQTKVILAEALNALLPSFGPVLLGSQSVD